MGLLGRGKRDSNWVGEISEAAIIARFLHLGYVVLTPYGHNQRYDLVIEDADGKFWRIQVKTGWLDYNDTVIRFAATSQTYHYNGVGNRGGTRRKNYYGQAEYFAVYVEKLRKVYLVPVNEVGTSHIVLRLAPTKNNQEKNVRWAKDYEL